MNESDNNELLAQYVRNKSEEAFAILVARHVNLVYSVAFRYVANSHQAEEISQVVFLLLARKAGSLSPKIILSGWLYRTAQLTAANYLRMENRRQRREQEVHMQSLMSESEPDVWAQISPVLDDVMGQLGEKERNAIVLRFIEGKSLKEVGNALGASEITAQKRVERALTKLRNFFAKRGLTLSAATLAGLLSTHSVQAAPTSLAEAIITAGITKGATVSGPSLLLMKSTLKIMTWLKIKTAVSAGVSMILIAGTATVAIAQIQKNIQPADPAIVEKLPPSNGSLPIQPLASDKQTADQLVPKQNNQEDAIAGNPGDYDKAIDPKLPGSAVKLEDAVSKSDAVFVGEIGIMGFASGGTPSVMGVMVPKVDGIEGLANASLWGAFVLFTVSDATGEVLPQVKKSYVFFVTKTEKKDAQRGPDKFTALKILPATDDNIALVKKLIAQQTKT